MMSNIPTVISVKFAIVDNVMFVLTTKSINLKDIRE